ncbi:hypothetical protein JR338_03495 [Chloroflexota bacterium]|nr:hypothetical protein JR338_03495 [Chloroflexota bacterium]
MSEIETIPFKAINVYINEDYLETVLKSVLTGYKKLPKQAQIEFVAFLRKYATVLGFRDPSRAPLTLQVNALAKAFENKDEVVPYVLSLWAKVNKKLAGEVKAWLTEQKFKDLETEREYAEDSGFTKDFPKKWTFDKVEKDFAKANPDSTFERDDLILMVLWISGQLPKD